MNIHQEAKNYYDNLYCLPPNDKELEEFATYILNAFIAELETNTKSIVWNYGLDSVIFNDNSKHGNRSLQQIKKEFLGDKSN